MSLQAIGRRAIKHRRIFERIRAGHDIHTRSTLRGLMSWLAAQPWPVLPPRPLWP
jgi:hypothetical protein